MHNSAYSEMTGQLTESGSNCDAITLARFLGCLSKVVLRLRTNQELQALDSEMAQAVYAPESVRPLLHGQEGHDTPAASSERGVPECSGAELSEPRSSQCV